MQREGVGHSAHRSGQIGTEQLGFVVVYVLPAPCTWHEDFNPTTTFNARCTTQGDLRGSCRRLRIAYEMPARQTSSLCERARAVRKLIRCPNQRTETCEPSPISLQVNPQEPRSFTLFLMGSDTSFQARLKHRRKWTKASFVCIAGILSLRGIFPHLRTSESFSFFLFHFYATALPFS